MNTDIKNIDQYILQFPIDVQTKLIDIRNIIQLAAPTAIEKISYGMPTYFLNGNLVHFAAYKNHIGFYPTPSCITAFKNALEVYKYSKGAVQFPLSHALPKELISEMVKFRVVENMKNNG